MLSVYYKFSACECEFMKAAPLCVSVCPLQVSQGNVPGVESASLAMDTEEGVEVVWNEVLFSDKKVFKAQEVLWEKRMNSSVFLKTCEIDIRELHD